MEHSFYWHDYETFGIDPAKDRPVQFAGLRTDLEFNIIGEPLVQYCKPASDTLPHPESCLITGITPQLALEKGVIEAEFIRRIHAEMSKPGTCNLGYNNIRFDDEVTRYCLYRNFYDPYAREWQNGNSRWDIIDMARMCYALRPDGINWPQHQDGKPSFKLEDLSQANNIQHDSAHDALSDVKATIAFAKLIKTKQPKLYDYLFNNRNKNALTQQLNIHAQKPVLHTSAMYASEYACTSLVVPIASHPSNRNSIIVYDLRFDPDDLINLDANDIQNRLFTKAEDLEQGIQRIAIKEIHINRCPVIAPQNTLSDSAAEKLSIDIAQSQHHLEKLKTAKGLQEKLNLVYDNSALPAISDPDLSLYSGGFFSNEDRLRMNEIINTDPLQLSAKSFAFEDKRLPEMLFRYRARNYPQSLSDEEQALWEEYRTERLTQPDAGGSITIDDYERLLLEIGNQADINSQQQKILTQLSEYAAILANH